MTLVLPWLGVAVEGPGTQRGTKFGPLQNDPSARLHLLARHRLQLFFNEGNVVGDMRHNTLKKCLERHSAIERVNASSPERRGVAGLQDRKHVCADRLYHVEFVIERPLWTKKSRSKQIGIRFEKSGVHFSKDALHAVRVDDL